MSIDSPDLTGFTPDLLPPPGWLSKSNSETPASRIREIVALTEGLFGGSCKVTVEMDPEIAGLESLVFEATTALDSREIVARSCKWHREVRQLVRDSHNMRLIFDVRR